MNRLPDYCECSKPDSQKRCRVACGKQPYPQNELTAEEIYSLYLKYAAFYEPDFFAHPNFPSWIYKKGQGDG